MKVPVKCNAPGVPAPAWESSITELPARVALWRRPQNCGALFFPGAPVVTLGAATHCLPSGEDLRGGGLSWQDPQAQRPRVPL